MKAEWSTDPGEFANLSTPQPVERLEDVIEAVDALPEELRAVINCVFWERLSAPQTIKALEISTATYYRRLTEAKRILGDMLRPDVSADVDGEDGQGLEVLVSPEGEGPPSGTCGELLDPGGDQVDVEGKVPG